MEISKVTTWLQRNKLQLNVSKSKFMMFFKHPKTLPKLNITANGNLIDQVSEFNFLGITIDENITWNPHIRSGLYSGGLTWSIVLRCDQLTY